MTVSLSLLPIARSRLIHSATNEKTWAYIPVINNLSKHYGIVFSFVYDEDPIIKEIEYWSQWSFNVVGRVLWRPPPLGMIKYIAKKLWLLSSPLMILDGVKVLIKGL